MLFKTMVKMGILYLCAIQYTLPGTLNIREMMAQSQRTQTGSGSSHHIRNSLVVAQVALALVLLVSSGLMIRTFRALVDVDPGFVRPAEVQTLRLSIPDSQVKDEAAVVRMHQAILDKLTAVPGVSSVALASTTTMAWTVVRGRALTRRRAGGSPWVRACSANAACARALNRAKASSSPAARAS